MKQSLPLLVLAFLLSSAAPAALEAAPALKKEVSGLQWLQSTPAERTEHLSRSMHGLRKQKVKLKRPIEEYYQRLYERLRRDPALYASDLTALLTDDAYELEPAAREAIDRLRAA